MKRIIALFGCLVVAAAYAAPAATTYDVEVLVFENRLPELEGGELWTQDSAPAPIADLADALAVGEPAPEDAALSAAAAALERDGSYRVLLHQRWRQSAEERSATKPMRIRNANGQLDGTLRVYLSRFPHVDLDLILQESAAAGPNFRLTESRRVKTTDLNYFDHPKFGVLLKVSTTGKE